MESRPPMDSCLFPVVGIVARGTSAVQQGSVWRDGRMLLRASAIRKLLGLLGGVCVGVLRAELFEASGDSFASGLGAGGHGRLLNAVEQLGCLELALDFGVAGQLLLRGGDFGRQIMTGESASQAAIPLIGAPGVAVLTGFGSLLGCGANFALHKVVDALSRGRYVGGIGYETLLEQAGGGWVVAELHLLPGGHEDGRDGIGIDLPGRAIERSFHRVIEIVPAAGSLGPAGQEQPDLMNVLQAY